VYVRTSAGVLAVRVDAAEVPGVGMRVTLRAPLSTLTFFDAAGARI
jgi:multiple sugar transport system ATP-binding protein